MKEWESFNNPNWDWTKVEDKNHLEEIAKSDPNKDYKRYFSLSDEDPKDLHERCLGKYKAMQESIKNFLNKGIF